MRLINIAAGITGAAAFIALAAYAHRSGGGHDTPMIFGALAQLSAACAALSLATRTGRIALIAALMLLVGGNLFAAAIQLTAFTGPHHFGFTAPIGGSLTILGWIVAGFAPPHRSVS